jgi:hypothetical protein
MGGFFSGDPYEIDVGLLASTLWALRVQNAYWRFVELTSLNQL